MSPHTVSVSSFYLRVCCVGKRLCQHLLHHERVGGNCDRVPGLHQQSLHIVGQPGHLEWRKAKVIMAIQGHLGISVLHGEENIAGWDCEAFWHRSDLQRQPTPMLLNNVLPASLVEELVLRVIEMLLEELPCLLYHLLCDYNSHQVLFQDVLQPKEKHFLKFSSSAFKIGEYALSS